MTKSLLRIFVLFLACLSLSYNKVCAQNKSAIAFNYVKSHASLFHLTTNDVADIRVIDENTDDKTGITHVYLNQFYKGINVYGVVAGVHINANNDVVHCNNNFQNNLDKKIKSLSPSISAVVSTNKAIQHLNIPLPEKLLELTSEVGKLAKPNEHLFAKNEIALKDISSQLMLLPLENGEINLVWKVNIYKIDARDWWDVFVDATSGNIITKNNAVVSCNFTAPAETDSAIANKYINNLSPTATGDFNVIVRPSEAPSFASRTVINSPWNLASAAASPFGWLNDGTTSYPYTRGNNVWAYLDTNNTNTVSATRSANGSSFLNFNFPIDFTRSPSTYTDAATTELFYATNTMHDIWYNYGFNEASRNFQKSNNGKGGVANDFLDAESQDSRTLTPCVRDNANMATSADGNSPRMQMYLWSANGDVKINLPSKIAADYPATSSATFGPCISNSNVTAKVILADTLDGCTAFKNPAAIVGNIALVYRGTCPFTVKVKNAQIAGAIGVIVINNVSGSPITMGGTDTSIHIPSLMVSDVNGATIRNTVDTSTVNATLTTSSPELDGDLDNGIIFHEYGHGITHRLTGDGSTCMNNTERGDEGWSDWYAMVLTQKPGDNANTARTLGTYVIGEPTTGSGIRTHPYSYDMSIDPHTYADVQSSGGEVHTIGEVWCSALWDIYWLMINKYGYDPNIYTGTGGNNKTMQLVIDGLKLQVCSPGFLDSRNAILKADSIDNAAANSCLLWSAFSRRGMGASAIQGSSNNTNDQTAAFDIPSTCSLIVLPITLLSVKANPVNDKINISWKTAGEYNNLGFEIQRKSSINEPFITVATVASKAENGSGASYSFDDVNVAGNVLYYYQIIQKDKDGKKNYSPVVTAIIHKSLPMNVLVFPNPADKNAYLQFGSGFGKEVSIKISDVFGRIVYDKILNNVSNSNVEINISNFAAGLYQINVDNKKNDAILRIIKK